MTLQGFDYVSATAAEVKNSGGVFAVRYLGTSSKCITAAELRTLHAAGLGVGLVFESTGVTFTGGAAAGQVDGAAAKVAAEKLGAPTDCPIWFAIDTDTADYAKVNEYLAGCAAACAPYPARLYGSFGVVENAPGHDHWQTYAWSAGRVSNAKASLYQYRNGSQMDHDETLGLGLAVRAGWLVLANGAAPAPVPAPAPAPKPSPVSRDALRVKGNSNARAAAAVKFEKAQVASGAAPWKGLCASLVRHSYGIPVAAWGNGTRTAAGAWHAVPGKLQHGWYNPPVGVPVFWTGGATGAGHVAVADGNGHCWSSDFSASGYVGDGKVRLVPIASISAHDPALKYVGWSETYLGVRVYG